MCHGVYAVILDALGASLQRNHAMIVIVGDQRENVCNTPVGAARDAKN